MIYIEISVCGSCIFYHPKYLSPSPHQGSNPNPSPAFRPAMQPQSSTDPASKRQWQEVLGSGSSINTMMNPLKTLVNPISRIDVSSLPSKQINLNVNSQQNFHENSWYSFGGISWQKFPLPFQDTSIIHSEPHRRARAGRSFKANSSSSVQVFFFVPPKETLALVFQIHDHPWSSMIIHYPIYPCFCDANIQSNRIFIHQVVVFFSIESSARQRGTDLVSWGSNGPKQRPQSKLPRNSTAACPGNATHGESSRLGRDECSHRLPMQNAKNHVEMTWLTNINMIYQKSCHVHMDFDNNIDKYW